MQDHRSLFEIIISFLLLNLLSAEAAADPNRFELFEQRVEEPRLFAGFAVAVEGEVGFVGHGGGGGGRGGGSHGVIGSLCSAVLMDDESIRGWLLHRSGGGAICNSIDRVL